MAGYQRWRLEFDSTNGGGVIAGSEIEFFSTVGGTDETASGGTASQSSTYAPFDAINAFDDNGGTLFAFNDTKGWIEWDFGSGNEKELIGFSFKARTDGAENQSFQVGRLQYYNGSAWLTLFHVTGSAYTLGQKKTFYLPASPACRYWRVGGIATRLGGADRIGASELEMRATAGGANECTGGTGFVDSAYTGSAASVFDGNTATEWWSNFVGPTYKGYVGYDFGVGVTKVIEEILYRTTSSLSDFGINIGTVDYSEDQIVWGVRFPIDNGGVSWGSLEARTFGSGYVPPVPGGRRRRSYAA